MTEAAERRDTIPVIAPAPPLDPSPGVIALLEELLEDAREGDIRTIAYAAIYSGQRVAHGTRGDEEPVDLFCLVGQLEKLKADILEQTEPFDPNELG